MESRQRRLTSGQFAKIQHVNRRTLHYYDQIGLFSPAEIGSNGYRYYTMSQCVDFSMLRALRELGVSIEELQSREWKPDVVEAIFREKIAEAEEAIRHFGMVKEMLEEKCRMLDIAKTEDLNGVAVKHVGERRLKKSRSIKGVAADQLNHVILELSEQFPRAGLFNHCYGFAIDVKNLGGDLTEQYDFIYAELRKEDDIKPDAVIPAGEYLVGYQIGDSLSDWNSVVPAYKRILDYAEKNGFELWGCAYEQGMNELAIDDLNDYVMQVMIPCRKKPE